jgi:hypothetical protein
MFPRVKSIAVCGLLLFLFVSLQRAAADPDESRPPVALPSMPVQELAERLKESILKTMPDELVFKTNNNWGHQAQVPSIQGVKLIQVMRNHGDWEKARVVTGKLPSELRVRVYDLQALDDKRIAFTMLLATPATVKLNRRIWQNGIEVYSAHVRARFQLTAALTIEATSTTVAKEAATPPILAGFQITRATFTCNDFVAENVNGLGGDFARLTRPHHQFWAWHPAVLGEFEKNVLTGVEAAGATSAVQANLSRKLTQAPAARFAVLQAEAAARARPPVTGTSPAPEVVPVTLLDGITIAIPPGRLEAARAAAPNRLIPPEHAEHYEHWGLSPHSIHYESASHTGSSIHTEPVPHAESKHKN